MFGGIDNNLLTNNNPKSTYTATSTNDFFNAPTLGQDGIGHLPISPQQRYSNVQTNNCNLLMNGNPLENESFLGSNKNEDAVNLTKRKYSLYNDSGNNSIDNLNCIKCSKPIKQSNKSNTCYRCTEFGGYTSPAPADKCGINRLKHKQSYSLVPKSLAPAFCCISIAVILSVLAFLFSSYVVGLGGYLKILDYGEGVIVLSKETSTNGYYVVDDDRIQKHSMMFNTSDSLDNIKNIKINKFNYTHEWLQITGSKDVEMKGLNVTDLETYLPHSLWKISTFPNVKNGYEYPLDNLNSVCLYQIIIEQMAAIQELTKRVEQLESFH